MTSKDVGNITEVSCMLEFMKLGYPVLTPYGDCQRYDFIVEINGKFYRIQSKTANDAYINEGYIVFRCDNTTTKNGKVVHHSYDENEIDYFSTFYDGECSTAPKNGQTRGITFASEYELEKVVANL